MPRKLTAHAVNPANEQLQIEVLDEPGPGGAPHLYRISGFDSTTNPSDPFTEQYGKPADHSTILFQNGPVGADGNGVNGVTHEALLAILVDRLAHFQTGPYACHENDRALHHLMNAQQWLRERTLARTARGVEGTHNV